MVAPLKERMMQGRQPMAPQAPAEDGWESKLAGMTPDMVDAMSPDDAKALLMQCAQSMAGQTPPAGGADSGGEEYNPQAQ